MTPDEQIGAVPDTTSTDRPVPWLAPVSLLSHRAVRPPPRLRGGGSGWTHFDPNPDAANVARYTAALAAIEELACAPAQPSLLLELCVERARALVRGCGAAVELLEDDELLFAATSGILRDQLGMVQSIAGTLCGTAVRTGEVVHTGDATTDPRGDTVEAARLGLRSVVSLPLAQDRRQIGVLLVCSSTPDMFTEEDVAVLQRLARVAGARLDLALARDARRRSEEALAASRQKYRTVLGAIDQGILVIDEYDRVALVNPAAERILGEPTYDLIGRRPSWVILREDGTPLPQRERPVQVALREQRVVADVTVQVIRSDGETRWVSTTASPLPVAEDGRRAAVVCFSDVTERRREAERLRHSQRLLAETQRLAQIGSWDWQLSDGHVTWTDEMYRLVGLEPQSPPMTEELYLDLTHPDDRPALRASLSQAFRRGGRFELSHRVVLGTGEVRYLHVTGEVVRQGGEAVRAWGSSQDVTDRLRVQDTLQRMALTDPLTGLGNRLLLVEQLREAVASLAGTGGQLTVIAVDLDGLKSVNDTHGHATGDELLRETARRLRSVVRDQDVVARLGGDEFVLLCAGVGAAGAVRLAERIVVEISTPYHLPDGITAWSGASVGVTITDDPAADVDRLLAEADRALYAAKAEGGSRYVIDPHAYTRIAG